MINFDYIPCCPDGLKAKKIAHKIKTISENNSNNQLKFLLNHRLGTKQIKMFPLSEINDFVKLSRKKLIQKIFYGSFHFRQSKSYVTDLVSKGNAFTLSEAFINTFKNEKLKINLLDSKSKIIAVELPSRHKRSIINKKTSNTAENKFRNTYKIFVKYIPRSNSYKSIKGKE